MNFENTVAKAEIAHDEQFLLLPQCFQLCLVTKLLKVVLNSSILVFLKLSAADLLYVGKG